MRLEETTKTVLIHLVMDAWVRQINYEVSDNYVRAIELVAVTNGIKLESLIPEEIYSLVPTCKYKHLKI
jgi:hypothetical protein